MMPEKCTQVVQVWLQVYYEDTDNGDRVEAYCSLKHCYSLPNDDDHLWICHGYYDDKEDLQSIQMGRHFLSNTDVQEKELVARCGLWHSRAQVIEGRFNLGHSQMAADAKSYAETGCCEVFWCNKTWDPATGLQLSGPDDDKHVTSRRSCSMSNRFILA